MAIYAVESDSVLLNAPNTPSPEEKEDLKYAVDVRLPDGLSWSFITSEVISKDVAPEDLDHMTAADIDWSGLDQQLGDESSFLVGVSELIGELSRLD